MQAFASRSTHDTVFDIYKQVESLHFNCRYEIESPKMDRSADEGLKSQAHYVIKVGSLFFLELLSEQTIFFKNKHLSQLLNFKPGIV